MVIKISGKHSVLVCLCALASVVAVTMAVNISRARGTSEKASVKDGLPASSDVSTESASSYKKNSSAVLSPAGAASGTLSSGGMLSGAGAASASSGKKNSSAVLNSESTASVTSSSNEMRAVWVPYLSLDISREADKSERAFKNKFGAIIQNAKSCGMNTLIVQVRPFGDALYKSANFPWSHILSGTQGTDPGYDPLADMTAQAHAAGLKIHAWVNPLRIQTSAATPALSDGNPYNIWKKDTSKSGWTVDFGGGKYYNPAYEGVRGFIAEGVGEIAKNYDVDGIQFDDYFYPSQDASFDQKEYDAYSVSAKKSGTPLSLAEWRRGNINALVSLCYRKIKAVKPSVVFGIAPQANVQNDLNMGADVYSWCSSKGYIDYICPQLYVNFENSVLPFGTAAQTWKDMASGKDIKLYFGLALYKANSDADNGTWKKSDAILAGEVKYGRNVPCDGFMFYSCDYLDREQTKTEVANMLAALGS